MTSDQIAAIRQRAAAISLDHDQCQDSWYSCPLSDDGCANDRETECSCDQPERVALKRDIETLLSEIDTFKDWQPGRWFRMFDPATGKLAMETSDGDEARAAAERYGWPLERLWRREQEKWVLDGQKA